MTTDIIDRLSNIAIFTDMADDTNRLQKIADRLTRQGYKAGQTIIKEGEEGDTLHILDKGQVRILRRTLDSEEFALVNLSADQHVFFGEIALIDNDRRSATVMAVTDCETLILKRRDYLELCDGDPVIGYRTAFRLASRLGTALRKANRDMITMYQALLDEIR